MGLRQAYGQGMYGPRYVWLIESWNSLDWWRNVTWSGCTVDQMYQVVQHYVGANFQGLRSDSTATISGLVSVLICPHVLIPFVSSQ